MENMISLPTISFKGLTGHWSKWGGGISDAVKKTLGEEWYCQSCGSKQPKIIPPYLYKADDDLILRICHVCLQDGCSVLVKKSLYMIVTGEVLEYN